MIAIIALLTYRWASLGESFTALCVTLVALIVAGFSMTVIGINFLLAESWTSFVDIDNGARISGMVLNFFILIGPYGNALLWGGFGLWCLKKAFDGGWYRGALRLRKICEEDWLKSQKKKQAERREREYRDFKRGERRKRVERWGEAAGRSFGRIMGWRS